MGGEMAKLVDMTGIDKHFPGVHALKSVQFDLVPPRGYFASAMAAHHSGSALAAGSRSISWAYADRGVSAGLTSISRALRPVPPDSHLDCCWKVLKALFPLGYMQQTYMTNNY